MIRKLSPILAAVGLSAVLGFTAASAATVNFEVTSTVDPNVGVSGEPGTTKTIGTAQVPAEAQGRSCDVVVDVHNNTSVREGTDLLVGSLEVADVEAVAGNAPPKNVGKLTVGATASVVVRFGAEGVASVNATVHFSCPDVPPPTTVPPKPAPVEAPVVVQPRTVG